MKRMHENKLVEIARAQLNEQGKIFVPQESIPPYSVVYVEIQNYTSGFGIIPLKFKSGSSAPIHHASYPGGNSWAYATMYEQDRQYCIEFKNYTDNKPLTGLWVDVFTLN